MGSLTSLLDHLSVALGASLKACAVSRDHLVLHIQRSDVQKVLVYLRDNARCQCKVLLDVCGVDYPARSGRFDVVYHLLSLAFNLRIRVILQTDEQTPVPSVTGIFSAADWWEREVWDMYGIAFEGHPDLRRILTDYNFQGFPLRKDFPLTGHVEVRYDSCQQQIVCEPVKLDQNYRSFDMMSPWEGYEHLVQGERRVEADPACALEPSSVSNKDGLQDIVQKQSPDETIGALHDPLNDDGGKSS